MILKESNDHRCYMSEYGIPTVQLGTGDIIVSHLSFKDEDEEFSGIGFSLGADSEIGKNYDELIGKTSTDVGVFLQIIATKPESIEIIIDKLEIAKQELLEKFAEEETEA